VAEANLELIYRVEEGARLPVSFYKNNIVHHFEEEAVLLGALLALGGTAVPREALLPRVSQLSRLLKRELSFRPSPLPDTVAETAERLQGFGILRVEGDTFTIPGEARERAVFLRDLLGDVIETYLAVLSTLSSLEGGGLDRKELARRCLECARALYLAGKIERVEAVSRPSVDIAVSWLGDEGHVVEREDGKLELAGPLKDAAARERLVAEVAEFLRA
jgi:glycerol-3-phosphate O-acyltransferase